MATAITICSNALLQFGKAPISSFEEPGDSARLCANLYPIERDTLLRENDWNFAKKRVLLAPTVDQPVFGFSAQFPLPADYLRMVSVGDWTVGMPDCGRFKVEGRFILASGTALPLLYIFRNDVEATWDSRAVELMTARMMWKLAYPVTQSTSLRDTLRDEYNAMARAARAIDAQENPSPTMGEDQFSLVQDRF